MERQLLLQYEGFDKTVYKVYTEQREKNMYLEVRSMDDQQLWEGKGIDKDDIFEKIFDYSSLFNIKKIISIADTLIEDIRDGSIEHRNIYLEMFKNIDNDYLYLSDECDLVKVIIDQGLVFNNDFYWIFNIAIMDIGTGKKKKAFGSMLIDREDNAYLGLNYVIEYDDIYNFVSQEINMCEDIIYDLEGMLKNDPYNVEDQEDILYFKAKKAYLVNQFIQDMNSANHVQNE